MSEPVPVRPLLSLYLRMCHVLEPFGIECGSEVLSLWRDQH
jgi:hypothetical protein